MDEHLETQDGLEEDLEETSTKNTEGDASESPEDLEALEADHSREGTLSKIGRILGFNKKTEETQEPEGDEDPELDDSSATDTDPPTTESVSEYEEVDPRFVTAARNYGWDDARIIKYAEGHDDHDLVMLTGMMEGHGHGSPDPDTTDHAPEVDPFEGLLEGLESEEDLGEKTKSVLKSLTDQLKHMSAEMDQIKNGLSANQEQSREGALAHQFNYAMDAFDKLSESFEDFGQSSKLSRLPDGSLNMRDAAVKTRAEVYDMATVFQSSGMSFEESIGEAVNWWKGKNGEKHAKKAVIRDLNKASSHASPKQHNRHTQRKFASEDERKVAVVNDALSRHGVTLQ